MTARSLSPPSAAPLPLPAGHVLRPARPDDLEAFDAICLATGDAGRDATAQHDDPTLLGAVFVRPYVVLEPDFAFAIVGPAGVAGYLLGTPDTARFARRAEMEWFAPLRQRIRDPGPDEAKWSGSDWVRRLIHRPEIAFPALLDAYPAHAHMDLLPPARGQGVGRVALAWLMERLASAGAPGLHLQVHPANIRAQGFYARLGFAAVSTAGLPAHTLFMARRLDRPSPAG